VTSVLLPALVSHRPAAQAMNTSTNRRRRPGGACRTNRPSVES
jgi:hypothetical protein